MVDTPHLREKTHKVGLIARAAAIFRVDEIITYRDSPRVPRNEIEFLAMILEYLSTPQYLRKILFPVQPALKYVGILPPLRTPNHPLGKERLEVGAFREGVVVESTPRSSSIDVGIGTVVQVPEGRLPVKTRVTVKVERNGYRIASADEIPHYWGYRVLRCDGITKWLKRGGGQLVIATSRFGATVEEVWTEFVESLSMADRCLILFGSPSEGLAEIVSREGKSLNEVADLILNTIPHQGTATVRTEEAVLSTLAIVNIAASMKKA